MEEKNDGEKVNNRPPVHLGSLPDHIAHLFTRPIETHDARETKRQEDERSYFNHLIEKRKVGAFSSTDSGIIIH